MPTQTSVDEDVKTEVAVDTGLVNLYTNYNQNLEKVKELGSKVRSLFVEVVDYIKANKLSTPVIKATLTQVLEKRGLSPKSVSSEISNIMSMCRPAAEKTFQQLKSGEITQKFARQIIATPQLKPARESTPKPSAEKVVRGYLYSAAKSAITDRRKAEGSNAFPGVQSFVELAAQVYHEVMAEFEKADAEKQAKLTAEQSNGEEGDPTD